MIFAARADDTTTDSETLLTDAETDIINNLKTTVSSDNNTSTITKLNNTELEHSESSQVIKHTHRNLPVHNNLLALYQSSQERRFPYNVKKKPYVYQSL